MLKHEEIVNNQLVFYVSDGRVYQIANVCDADRGNDDEKEYSIIDVVSTVERDGICEHSGLTQDLEAITKEKALLYLRYEEGDLLAEYGKVQKELAEVQLAISEIE